MKQRSEQGRAHHVDPPKASRVGSITVLSGTLSLTKIYLTETRRCPNGGATLSQPGRAIPAGLRADFRGHPRGNVVHRLFPGADRPPSNFSACGRADVPTLARSQCFLPDRAGTTPGCCWKQLCVSMLHAVLVVVCDHPRALTVQLLERACRLLWARWLENKHSAPGLQGRRRYINIRRAEWGTTPYAGSGGVEAPTHKVCAGF